ncbi:hypothetical protein Tco_0422730 [Tanacetum coccineum]
MKNYEYSENPLEKEVVNHTTSVIRPQLIAIKFKEDKRNFWYCSIGNDQFCSNSWLRRSESRKCDHDQTVYYVEGLKSNLFLSGGGSRLVNSDAHSLFEFAVTDTLGLLFLQSKDETPEVLKTSSLNDHRKSSSSSYTSVRTEAQSRKQGHIPVLISKKKALNIRLPYARTT